jgi:hypothetical protein
MKSFVKLKPDQVHLVCHLKQEQTCQSDEPQKERREQVKLQLELQERILHWKWNQQRLGLPKQWQDRAGPSLKQRKQDNQPSMRQDDGQKVVAKFWSAIRVETMANQKVPAICQEWKKIQEKPWTALMEGAIKLEGAIEVERAMELEGAIETGVNGAGAGAC